jgi:hypothetical protein
VKWCGGGVMFVCLSVCPGPLGSNDSGDSWACGDDGNDGTGLAALCVRFIGRYRLFVPGSQLRSALSWQSPPNWPSIPNH